MNIFTFLVTCGCTCLFFICGASAVDADSVSVKEGDDVTLHAGVELRQLDRMTWYFGEHRIAGINGDQTKTCTDDQCKERFRDRLKLDQTGSLTITNINTADSGDYKVKITSRNTENIFRVTVHDVQDELKIKSVKEGESVTLDPGVIRNTNDSMTWCFKDICIAVVNEELRTTCTDCDERLRLDQTGSLTITDTRSTDSGEYQLQISSSRFTIIRRFSLTVTGSGLSRGELAGICAAVAVLLLVAAAVCVFYFYKRLLKKKNTRMQHSSQQNGVDKVQNGVNSFPNPQSPLMAAANQSSSNPTDGQVKNTNNGLCSNHIETEPEADSEV